MQSQIKDRVRKPNPLGTRLLSLALKSFGSHRGQVSGPGLVRGRHCTIYVVQHAAMRSMEELLGVPLHVSPPKLAVRLEKVRKRMKRDA